MILDVPRHRRGIPRGGGGRGREFGPMEVGVGPGVAVEAGAREARAKGAAEKEDVPAHGVVDHRTQPPGGGGVADIGRQIGPGGGLVGASRGGVGRGDGGRGRPGQSGRRGEGPVRRGHGGVRRGRRPRDSGWGQHQETNQKAHRQRGIRNSDTGDKVGLRRILRAKRGPASRVMNLRSALSRGRSTAGGACRPLCGRASKGSNASDSGRVVTLRCLIPCRVGPRRALAAVKPFMEARPPTQWGNPAPRGRCAGRRGKRARSPAPGSARPTSARPRIPKGDRYANVFIQCRG